MRNQVLIISLVSAIIASLCTQASAAVRTVSVRLPPATNNIAASRNMAVCVGHGLHIKNKAMSKFVAGLTGPATIDTTFGIAPVSFLPSRSLPLLSREVSAARCLFVSEPEISCEDDSVVLQSGSAIIDARRPMTLLLPEARIELKKGAVIKVYARSGFYEVINLVDDGRDSVSLHVCKRHLSLGPGQEARFSVSPDAVSRHIKDGCGRRTEKDQSCCTYSIKVNEVSTAGLLKHDPIGRQIYRSSSGADRRLVERILKTAAALAFWTKAKTPYSWE